MTVDTTCPNCGTLYTLRSDLIGKRTKCTRCGTHFVITETAHVPTSAAAVPPASPIQPTPPPPPIYGDIPTHLPHVARTEQRYEEPGIQRPQRTRTADFLGFERDKEAPRYPAIKLVARGYEILAIIALVCTVGWIIFEIALTIRAPKDALLHLFNSIIAILWGLATALMCLFVSQMTRLVLQIEYNTRETSSACRQLAEHFSAIEHEP